MFLSISSDPHHQNFILILITLSHHCLSIPNQYLTAQSIKLTIFTTGRWYRVNPFVLSPAFWFPSLHSELHFFFKVFFLPPSPPFIHTRLLVSLTIFRTWLFSNLNFSPQPFDPSSPSLISLAPYPNRLLPIPLTPYLLLT